MMQTPREIALCLMGTWPEPTGDSAADWQAGVAFARSMIERGREASLPTVAYSLATMRQPIEAMEVGFLQTIDSFAKAGSLN